MTSSGHPQKPMGESLAHTEPAQVLSQSDTELARVLEDLIDVLIGKGLLQFTDLPEAAQKKLLNRRTTRGKLSHSLELLPGEDEHGIL